MMTSEQLATLVSWLREQAGDGAHQPPSEHGQRFTEAADYIESTSRAFAVREKVAMTTERWVQLKSWTWFKEAQVEVTIELDRSRDAEVALRAALDVDLGRADRDAIYRHDLKALAADGAHGDCHTDVGTLVRNRLAGLQAELQAAVEATEAKRKERDDALFQCVSLDKELTAARAEIAELKKPPGCM